MKKILYRVSNLIKAIAEFGGWHPWINELGCKVNRIARKWNT